MKPRALLPLALLVLSCTLPTSVIAGAGDNGGSDTGKLFENLEIMRRLLVKQVNRTPPATTPAADNYAGFVSHTGHSKDTFFVPDMGAFFVLETRIPLVEIRKPAPVKKEVPADEWEKTKNEVRNPGTLGRATLYIAGRQKQESPVLGYEFSKKEVERTVETALKTLAVHGARLDGVDSSEFLTVSLTLRAGDYPANRSTNSLSMGLYALGYTSQPPTQRIVIQIPKGYAEDHEEGKMSLSEIRERARIRRF